MASGSPSKLVLTLTHSCNLRCPYCPLTKTPGLMSFETAESAASLFFQRHAGGPRIVKFFGGEPMLAFPMIRSLARAIRRKHGGQGVSFFLSTNATRLDRAAGLFFRDNPDIELAVSGVLNPRELLGLPNFHLNIPIPPRLAGRLGEYVARLLSRGFLSFNFLPAYYTSWTPGELSALERGFSLTAGLIRRHQERGHAVDVKNLAHWAPTPLYNHGMVVGPEGDVFPCNLVFADGFRHLQPDLRLGRVSEPDSIDWDKARAVRYDRLLRKNMDPQVYRSTMAVDRLLTGFVETLSTN